MEQRRIREEIFKILFEHEIVNADAKTRSKEFLEVNKLSKSKEEFFVKYIDGYLENEKDLVVNIKKHLKGWTYERLGVVEKVLLKMSFYEIVNCKIGHEIVINEAVEIAKIYGDVKTKNFINGILADLVEEMR
ncbi:transcription antitermination factor NusB [uncultured Sneathia sp.]|jgi:hypothetical protein|uniref:transcription antitermination factor NusB n=1 Tax=uncultured Sneathia sp. TaxID=278067 RepID=UPI0025934E03|nr:transcription antitermination factor NusB [uncultured Sneathia sp.]